MRISHILHVEPAKTITILREQNKKKFITFQSYVKLRSRYILYKT